MLKILLYIFILLLFKESFSQDFKHFIQSGRIELLGGVFSFDNSSYPLNNNESWIFMSIVIPGLAKGNINAPSTRINNIFNGIATSRQDISSLFTNFYYDSNNKFNIGLMCQDKPTITSYNTTTGLMSIYIYCYNSINNFDFIILPNSTAPLTSVTPIMCEFPNLVCSEGYCVMFERQIFIPETTLLSVIQKYYCPNDFINFINFESRNHLFYANYITSVRHAAKACIELTSTYNIFLKDDFSYFWWVSCFIPNATENKDFYPLPDFTHIYSTPYYIIPSMTNNHTRLKYHNYKNFVQLILLIFLTFHYIN